MPEYNFTRHGDVLLNDPFGNEIRVRPESVEVWLEKGYTLVDPGNKVPDVVEPPSVVVPNETGEV